MLCIVVCFQNDLHNVGYIFQTFLHRVGWGFKSVGYTPWLKFGQEPSPPGTNLQEISIRKPYLWKAITFEQIVILKNGFHH